MRSEWVATLEAWIDEIDRCIRETGLEGVQMGFRVRLSHTHTYLTRGAQRAASTDEFHLALGRLGKFIIAPGFPSSFYHCLLAVSSIV